MSLTVVPVPTSVLAADRTRGVLVIESDVIGPPFNDAFDELNSIDARNLAIAAATQAGMSSPMINGNLSSPYPVNSEGVSLDKVRGPGGEELAQNHPRMQPVKYRIDVPVARPLR